MGRNRGAFPVVRVATAACLIASLGFLIFHAAERGVADLYGRDVRFQLEKWEKERKPVRLSEWQGVLASAQAEQRLNPHNPDALEGLGRLYDWAAFGKRPEHPVVLAFREQALIYFRKAVRQRPVSGYTWANIAQSKLALGAFDAEFTQALELAALLAPWEPEVQFSITDAGLAAWVSLDGRRRQIVRQAAARGLKRHAKNILSIAQHRNRLNVICELPEALPVATPGCR